MISCGPGSCCSLADLHSAHLAVAHLYPGNWPGEGFQCHTMAAQVMPHHGWSSVLPMNVTIVPVRGVGLLCLLCFAGKLFNERHECTCERCRSVFFVFCLQGSLSVVHSLVYDEGERSPNVSLLREMKRSCGNAIILTTRIKLLGFLQPIIACGIVISAVLRYVFNFILCCKHLCWGLWVDL